MPVPDLDSRKRTSPLCLDGLKISHGTKEVGCLVVWFGLDLFDAIEVTLQRYLPGENLQVAHRSSRNCSVIAPLVLTAPEGHVKAAAMPPDACARMRVGACAQNAFNLAQRSQHV